MKARFYSRTGVRGVLTLVVLAIGVSGVLAAPSPKKAAATNGVEKLSMTPQSVFVVPSSPAEGCDPFFPDSTRIFGVKSAAPKVSSRVDIGALVLNGLSGTTEHRLAMINGHTFAEGEKAEINTSSGRIQIKCVEIKTGSVVIEVNGQRQELHLAKDLF